MRRVTVSCDYCGQDLSSTDARPDYRLSLECESLPQHGNITFAVYVQPPIEKSHHFCGMGCLKRWVNGESRSVTNTLAQKLNDEVKQSNIKDGNKGNE